MKKIFITGLAGMLGCNVAYELKNDYSLSGVDLFRVNMDGVNSYDFDILDYKKMLGCLERVRPDIIIHTAAAVNVDKCEMEPDYAKKLNVKMTENVCKAAEEVDARVIYISTDAVFDGQSKHLYSETDFADPINIYGKTKLEGENIVRKNRRNLILRTNIYGFNIQNKNSFGEWIYTNLLKNKKINMFTDIDFSPILVNDLAKVIGILIERDISGIYHVCGTGYISKYDFGCALKRIFKINYGEINKAISDSFSFKAKRSKHMGMSNEKICDLLDYRLRTPVESIEEFYDMYISGFKEELIKFGGIEYAD